MVEVKPKPKGWPGINIYCPKCGGYYSEAQGHTCGEDKEYY